MVGWICCHLRLELGLLYKSLMLCLSGARFSANMPGNAALCEPIDLQSERPSMNAATFYKHSLGIYIYSLKGFKILHPIVFTLDYKFLATETFILQISW